MFEQLAIAIRLRVGFQRWQAAYSDGASWMRPAENHHLRGFFARTYGPDQTAW